MCAACISTWAISSMDGVSRKKGLKWAESRTRRRERPIVLPTFIVIGALQTGTSLFRDEGLHLERMFGHYGFRDDAVGRNAELAARFRFRRCRLAPR
jgi:hypothetical protein